MIAAGIDIGSRSIELVVVQTQDAQLVDTGTTFTKSTTQTYDILIKRRLPTTFNPVQQMEKILGDTTPDVLVATGYGRKLLEKLSLEYATEAITEIKAHALGARHNFPQARTVLDIGGQDTKAIAMTETGKVSKFEMNDRCAAGTGKFLEYTANVFQIPVDSFGQYALRGDNPPVINSMCTVFAETEATSLMAQGIKPENIALGLHHSIARRTTNMLQRVVMQPPLVFSGGVAYNPCMVELLCNELQLELNSTLFIDETPDMTGALGAALWAAQHSG